MHIDKSKILLGNKALWTIYIVLIAISMIEVYSSSGKSIMTPQGNYIALLAKQFILILAGVGGCFVCSKISYKKLTRAIVSLLWGISLACLFAVLISGRMSGDSAARWIDLGIFQFQPSELAKYTLMLMLAQQMAFAQNELDSKKLYWTLLIEITITSGLIFFDNFSTAALIFISGFILMFIGGVNRRLWTYTFLLLIVAAILFVFLTKVAPDFIALFPRGTTWVNRINNYGTGDITDMTQQNEALTAIATGGFIGRGIGNTIQSRFLDEGQNDFIFAIILEEGGIWLCLIILILYICLMYNLIKVANNCGGYFGTLTTYGFAIIIGLQSIINMSVSVGLMPVTGQTLPFISYGGTSFVLASMYLGMVINISKYDKKTTKQTIDSKQDAATDVEEQQKQDLLKAANNNIEKEDNNESNN